MQVGINLAHKKQAGFVTGTRGGTAFTSATRFGDIKVNVEDLKELPLMKIISAIALGILAGAYADNYKEGLIAAEDKKLDEMRVKVAEIKKKEKKLREFDRKRKSLEQDEQVIVSKIETINKLVAARNNSINTLMFISKSMPTRLWMNSFAIQRGKMTLRGQALQEDYVYQFMRKLNNGSFFENVNPSQIRRSSLKVPQGIVETTQFELTAEVVRKED